MSNKDEVFTLSSEISNEMKEQIKHILKLAQEKEKKKKLEEENNLNKNEIDIKS